MVLVFWRPLSVPSDHASISRNALRWLMISTIFYSGTRRRLISEPIQRVSTDVADKHARYISEIHSPAKSRRSRMNRAIMARIVASIAVFVNAPPLYLPREGTIANARIAHDALFFCRENGGQQVMFFWHLHVLPPIRGFALFNWE